MLKLDRLSLRRGSKLLFQDVSLIIHAGQKVGITGANGSGKSSLFALILGELGADSGDLSLPARTRVAHVSQETPAVDRPALEFVIDGDQELRRIEASLVAAQVAGDGHGEAEWHGRYEVAGGYTANSRAGRLLHGLGFTPEQESWPIHRFSGGWRVRLNLAQALMCRSDLLLLDEPTNHLDLDAILWLETWLQNYPGTLLLISHDRDFLDGVVTQIAQIDNQRLRLYPGNYSAFEIIRAQQLSQQQAAYEQQQREIKRIEGFVERFRAKATKARQAQSRLKAMERLERIAPAHVDSPFHFEFAPLERLPNPLLQIEQAQLGYAGMVVLDKVRLSLHPGDRIGLLGPNGAGKSTLIKTLAGELPQLAGRRQVAEGLVSGYFAQHQVEQLRPQDSPLLHLQRLASNTPEQVLRDYLGGFAFGGDQALRPVGTMSGGEKSRLVLALLIYQRPSLLLLDEPTNHLDLEMRHALGEALQDFQGAMVLVSHDRALLRSTCDQLLLIHEGRVHSFAGDIDDYPGWLAEQEAKTRPPTQSELSENSARARKEQRRADAEWRRQLQPLRQRVKKLEDAMARLGAEQTEIQGRLLDPALYEETNKARLIGLLAEQSNLQRRLASVEEDWLSASAELEEAGGEGLLG